jgi:hypothetical protein
MPDSVKAPNSVFIAGKWWPAHWRAEIVNETTGEIVITVTIDVPGLAPQVLALRMDMSLARALRQLAGFVEAPAPTNEEILAAMGQWGS